MRFATISVLVALATAAGTVHAAGYSFGAAQQHAMSVLPSLNPLATARVRDVTSQALNVVPRFHKKSAGVALLQQCEAHEDCAGDEYCDEGNGCWGCEACETLDDAIDGECPPCGEGNTDGPELTLEQALCLLSNAGPCLSGLMSPTDDSIIDTVTSADTANEAVEALEGFCQNCTDATGEFEDIFDTCNITNADAQSMLLLIADLLDNSCDETECAGNILWAFQDIEERQDAFCEHQECGLPILEPLLTQASEDADVSETCVTGFFNLYCLQDQNQYCLASLEGVGGGGGEDDDFNIGPFCDTTCPAELTVAFQQLDQNECGFDISFTPDCDTLDYEFVLLDYCTVNDDEEYCIELVMETEFPSDCDEMFNGGDMVPAPGMETNGTNGDTCPTCRAALETYADTLGCCTAWMLDIQCAPQEIIDTVTDDCGVTIGDACERPVLPSDVVDAAPTLKTAIAVAACAVAAIVAAIV